MITSKIKESRIEKYLGKRAKQLNFLYWKFPATEMDGVPDRILIGHGRTVFVELKKPGEGLRKKQSYRHRQIKEHGGDVRTISSVGDAEALLVALTK